MNFEPLSDIRFGWRSKLNFAHFVCGGSEEEKNEGRNKKYGESGYFATEGKKEVIILKKLIFCCQHNKFDLSSTSHGEKRFEFVISFAPHFKHLRRLLASPVSGRWGKIEFSTCASLHIGRREQYFFVIFFFCEIFLTLQVSTRASTISSNIHSGLTRLTQNEIFNLSTLSPSATLREGKIQISDTPRGRKNAKNFCVWCVVADCRPNVLSFQVKKLLFLLSVKIFSQTFFPTKRKFSFSVFFCFLYVFSTKQMLCFTSRVPQTQPVVVCPSLLSQKYIILAEPKNDEQK